MKKVIVLLAAAALLAAPAFGGIRNSKHDLSSSSTSAGTVKSNDTDELCVFCHTPHGGATGGFAPLWNRSLGSLTLTTNDLYNSATIEVGITNPTEVLGAVGRSDAKLCLSCHDGGSLATGLLNPPASNGNTDPNFDSGKDTVSGFANLFDGTAKLTNDHPIGMTYDAALATADGELATPNSTDFVDAAEALPLYSNGTDVSVMWCSSCHDVHNPDKGTPFLNMTNAGSALCLTCHLK